MITHSYFDTKTFNLRGNRAGEPVAIIAYDGITSCLLCQGLLQHIELSKKIDTRLFEAALKAVDQRLSRFSAICCAECGWWQIVFSVYDDEDTDYGNTKYVQAILKEFDVSSKDAPLAELAHYLSRHGEDIYHIHWSKMEQLVASIFREHFDCEVIHCGATGDRGIDLFLVMGDELIPVQVKKRTKSGITESVKTIREMLGVMYRDQFRKGKIVSTAEKFSPSGIIDIRQVISNGLADEIELVNCRDFISILRTYYQGSEKSYLDIASQLVSGRSS